MMDRQAVARTLEQIASFLELKGENTFRIRAMLTAARAVNGLPVDLETALADGSLAAARGVGPATLKIIEELARTGRSSLLEDLREQIPPGLVEMLAVSGLGVTKVRQIHEALGIDSLTELEAAARDGRLAKLPRFGPRTAENILKSISFLRQTTGVRLAHHAAGEAAAIRQALQSLPGVTRAVVAGEVRRRLELIGEIVIVLIAEASPEEIFSRLGALPGVSEFAGQDERRVTLRFAGGSAVQVVVTTPVNAGAVLVQATGSDEHLQQLAARAGERGFVFNGAALWEGSRFVPTPDEAALYQALDLQEIPPELREGRGEAAAAAGREIPRLIEPGDLQGFIHCHTTYSDGSCSVADLADACRAAGYRYLGITDHSRSAAYAGGLAEDDLVRQAEEIDAVNAGHAGFRVLKGVEADILVDGRLDYDDATLARLDFVIGSIHTRFQLDRDEMTARVLAAMDNPFLSILGHPTGRLLLGRSPYAIDLDRVFAKAAANGIAIEINADPHRLDLDWRELRRAAAAGVMISIGADAHSIATMGHMEYGVGIARKGWLRREDVLNTRPVEEFLAFVHKRRG
ncbi:MAG: DNA polymerase/3'-5' exonuclease PolX [Gemmatimonadales bacterium]